MPPIDEPEPDRGPAPPPPFGAVGPQAIAREERIEAVQDRVGELAGVFNGTAAALVDLVADAMAERLWEQWGVHSPTH